MTRAQINQAIGPFGICTPPIEDPKPLCSCNHKASLEVAVGQAKSMACVCVCVLVCVCVFV